MAPFLVVKTKFSIAAALHQGCRCRGQLQVKMPNHGRVQGQCKYKRQSRQRRVSNVADIELPRVIYLQLDRSKVAKQIPAKLQDWPRRGPAKRGSFKRSKQRRKANPL